MKGGHETDVSHATQVSPQSSGVGAQTLSGLYLRLPCPKARSHVYPLSSEVLVPIKHRTLLFSGKAGLQPEGQEGGEETRCGF